MVHDKSAIHLKLFIAWENSIRHIHIFIQRLTVTVFICHTPFCLLMVVSYPTFPTMSICFNWFFMWIIISKHLSVKCILTEGNYGGLCRNIRWMIWSKSKKSPSGSYWYFYLPEILWLNSIKLLSGSYGNFHLFDILWPKIERSSIYVIR